MENKNQKPYENLQFGFDRTQMYKEFIQPQINRSTALTAVMDFCKLNGIRLTTKETLRMVDRYVSFIETGDTSWAKMVDEYLIKKYEDLEV